MLPVNQRVLFVSPCNIHMVNADTAPALPWGASNGREDVEQGDAIHSRGSDGLTTAESAPDHLQEAWPSSGSTIEVNIAFHLLCVVCKATFGSAIATGKERTINCL